MTDEPTRPAADDPTTTGGSTPLADPAGPARPPGSTAPPGDESGAGDAGASEIDAYLRQHAGRYTHQALDAQLRAAGHSDAAIAAAWSRVQGPMAAGGGPQPLPPAGFAGFLYVLAVLAIVVFYGGSALLAGLGTLVFSSGGSGNPLQALVLVAYAVAIIVAAVVAFRFLTRVDRRRRGVLPMLGAIAVVAVVYIGLCGLCFGGLGLASNVQT